MTASPAAAEGQPESAKVDASGHSRRNSTSSTIPIAPSGGTRRKKNWEIFPGRNKFYCDGRIIMAQQTGVLFFTFSLIFITVTLFFVFELTLVTEIHLGFLIPVFAGLLVLFCLSCLFRTAWSDPGIIPRATAEEAAYIEKYLQNEQTRHDGTSGYRPPPRTIDVVINGTTLKLKYCFTCKIFRPPRASHCSQCDNCVENFDHHCPWVGNCVGRRNYRYFYLFVSSLSLLCCYIFAFAIVNIVLLSQKDGFWNALKVSPGRIFHSLYPLPSLMRVSAIEIFICFFSVWSVIGLSGYHSYLICRFVTTNEDIKGMFSKKRTDEKNPFDRGNCCYNFLYILCAPTPSSVINRRGYASQAGVDEYEAAQTRVNRIKNSSSYGASQSGLVTYHEELRRTGSGLTECDAQQFPGGKPYPVMDMESYDTRSATYPRQPNYQPPSNTNQSITGTDNTTVANANQTAIAVDSDAQAAGDNVQLQENVVEFHQSPCYSPSTGKTELEVESKSPVSVNMEEAAPGEINLDGFANASVLSADSTTFLLEKNLQQNGVDKVAGGLKNDKIGSKKTKISSV